MTVKTRNDLARQLGVSPGTVTRYLARADFPVKRKPPWSETDLVGIRSWKAALQDDRRDVAVGGSTAEKVNTGLKLERMLHERVKRLEREGTLVRRELLDAGILAMARLFVRCLDDLVRTLPLQLADLAEFGDVDRRDVLAGKIEQHVVGMVRRIREDLADRARIEVDQADLALARDKLARARGRPASRR